MISLMLEQIKSTETSDFILLRSLLMLATFAFDCTITLSMLFIPIGKIICFLERPFIVMLSLGLPFWLDLLMTLWISEILSRESFRNAFLIFKKFWILLLKAWVYEGLLLWLFGFDSWLSLSLKNLDLAKILLLGQGGIGREILETLAYLPLSLLSSFRTELFENFLLNCTEIHCLKYFCFLLAANLSQPDL